MNCFMNCVIAFNKIFMQIYKILMLKFKTRFRSILDFKNWLCKRGRTWFYIHSFTKTHKSHKVEMNPRFFRDPGYRRSQT